MADRHCILCLTYRPDVEPRLPDRSPVCEGDRYRLGRQLEDIGRLHSRLVNPDPVEYDDRQYDAQYELWDKNSKAWVVRNEQRRTDPLGAIGGVAPIPSRNSQPSVSGSRERPIPINVDSVDLAAHARPGSVGIRTRGDWSHRPGGDPDQVGRLSVATVLDFWVRDWRDTLWLDQHLPPATVPELIAWLRVGASEDAVGVRIDDACDRHPAIDEMAIEVHNLRRALRGVLGETDPQPELIDGVACRSCDLRALVRQPDDFYRAECGGCGLLYTDAEFAEWVTQLGGLERDARSPEEVRHLLQRA